MRTKNSFINSIVSISCIFINIIPTFLIRKSFIEHLGTELLGLISLYSNIIGWLSIIDMGISSSIVFYLYKPYLENDYEKINIYLSYYRRIYTSIGIIILILGTIISPFIKFFIDDGNIDNNVVTLGMILFTFNTFLSYIFSYKVCLFNVSQKAYKITLMTTLSKLIISIFQYIMLHLSPDFILYMFIQIIVNFLYYLYLDRYTLKYYPWISKSERKMELSEKKLLSKNVRSMFMHKIGDLFINSTDNIVISKFLGLTLLSKYANYQIILDLVQNCIKSLICGTTASIGNLIAEGDMEKSYDIHKKLFFINFWLSSFIFIILYNTLNQFMVIWLGKDIIIDDLSFIIILINLYFKSMRGSVEQFQSGSGIFYKDRYAPIIESIINISISIVLVNYIGLPGVFIGTLVSNFTVIFWTKPYIVYKYVFEKNVLEYFKIYFKYMMISIIPFIFTDNISLHLKYNYTIVSFLINIFVNIVIINAIYFVMFRKTDEFIYLLNILKKVKIFRKG